MGGRAEIFQLLVGEDVDGDQMDLGVTVLAGLGGGHLDNLARAVLDDDEAVLPQSRTLHGVGLRGTGIGALEGVLMLHAMRSAGVQREMRMLLSMLRRNSPHGNGSRWGKGAAHAGLVSRKTYLRVVRHGDE